MVFDVVTRVVSDPYGEEREAWGKAMFELQP